MKQALTHGRHIKCLAGGDIMAALFDTIHDDALSKRAEPATLAEFVEFGLKLGCYVVYHLNPHNLINF